jgi:hypothetical protein
MKTLATFLFLMCAIVGTAETELEKVFRQAMPGAYGRMDGMVYLLLELRSDGTYIFSQSDCFTSGGEKGKWSIQDDVVVLDRKEAVFRHFRIYPMNDGKSLALLPLDDVDIRKDQEEEDRLFTPYKRRGPNESPEATPGQRPPTMPSPSSGAPQL